MEMNSSDRKYFHGGLLITVVIGLLVFLLLPKVFSSADGTLEVENNEPVPHYTATPTVVEPSKDVENVAESSISPVPLDTRSPEILESTTNGTVEAVTVAKTVKEENELIQPSELGVSEPNYRKKYESEIKDSSVTEGRSTISATAAPKAHKVDEMVVSPPETASVSSSGAKHSSKSFKSETETTKEVSVKPEQEKERVAPSKVFVVQSKPVGKSSPSVSKAADTPVVGGLLWEAKVAGVIDDSRAIPCGGLWDYYPEYFGENRKFYALEQYCDGSHHYLQLKKGDSIGINGRKCSVVGFQDLNYNSDSVDDVDWLGSNAIVQTCYRGVSGPVKLIRFNCN